MNSQRTYDGYESASDFSTRLKQRSQKRKVKKPELWIVSHYGSVNLETQNLLRFKTRGWPLNLVPYISPSTIDRERLYFENSPGKSGLFSVDYNGTLY